MSTNILVRSILQSFKHVLSAPTSGQRWPSCRRFSSVCWCASVSLRPLTCDNVKGHRWGPWEQRCTWSRLKLGHVSRQKEIMSLKAQIHTQTERCDQRVSPEGGSSSWLPLCAERLHAWIKKAAKGLWPRHTIHMGIQNLAKLCCIEMFCLLLSISKDLRSMSCLPLTDIWGTCQQCMFLLYWPPGK